MTEQMSGKVDQHEPHVSFSTRFLHTCMDMGSLLGTILGTPLSSVKGP